MANYINMNSEQDSPWARYEKHLDDIGIPHDETCRHAYENDGDRRQNYGEPAPFSSPECLECLGSLPIARVGLACMKCMAYKAL
ncbi:MAG: hypothetical protein LBI17_01285 [Rickettsiales bacterium]|jgi:hypothetical protein|nr:hypothetical protein [Rickettsiales bacterium]